MITSTDSRKRGERHLGLAFDIDELALIRGITPMDLHELLSPAIDLGIVLDNGSRMAFQHGVVQTIISERRQNRSAAQPIS